jgi:hypothetical protein
MGKNGDEEPKELFGIFGGLRKGKKVVLSLSFVYGVLTFI